MGRVIGYGGFNSSTVLGEIIWPIPVPPALPPLVERPMTRKSLARSVFWSTFILAVVLVVAFVAKLADNVPGIAGSPLEKLAHDIYDYCKEMAPVLISIIAVHLASTFRKRSNFIESLEEEWRGIVKTKSALYAYCEKPYPSSDDYIAAFSRISETIDSMRIVYRNAGETDELIGLYPYAPLHDMRRALSAIDPRSKQNISAADRKLVQDAVLQSFYALRETFLEELDLQQPVHPLLISGGRRAKKPGAAPAARAAQDRQKQFNDANTAMARPDIDAFLEKLYLAEHVGTTSVKSAPAAQRGREA